MEGTLVKLPQLWIRSWLDTVASASAMAAPFRTTPYDIRDRWFAAVARMASDCMRSPEFLESMARGLLLMTYAARVASQVPHFSAFAIWRQDAPFGGKIYHGYRTPRIS